MTIDYQKYPTLAKWSDKVIQNKYIAIHDFLNANKNLYLCDKTTYTVDMMGDTDSYYRPVVGEELDMIILEYLGIDKAKLSAESLKYAMEHVTS